MPIDLDSRQALHLWLIVVAFVLPGCYASSDPQFQDQTRAGSIVLGSPSLVAGIPGDSALTNRQIETWLDNPAVHAPLAVCLPLGLHVAGVTPNDALVKELTRAKIELGRQLFFDPRLAHQNVFSCSSCHDPKQKFKSYIDLTKSLRDPAVAFNRILSNEQFWDGHAKSLREQPFTPVVNSAEMNTTPEALVKRLQAINGYHLQFERIYGVLNFENVCDAVASFECTLVTSPSAWDFDVTLKSLSARDVESLSLEEQELLAEAKTGATLLPLSDSARRGAELFFSDRTNCAACHSGPNFTDEGYYKLGVQPTNDDPGRFTVTKNDADRGAFKTPTLRNVADTWPYMHNGRFRTLEAAVDWILQGGEGPHSDLRPVELTTDERTDLLEFLKSLSSPVPQPEQFRLPQ